MCVVAGSVYCQPANCPSAWAVILECFLWCVDCGLVFCCSFFGVMPAYSSLDSSLGAKLVSFYPTNVAKGTATHHAVIVLLAPQTGIPLAVGGADVCVQCGRVHGVI